MDRKKQDKHLTVEDTFFICCNCGHGVNYLAAGTMHRNHCPLCLWSLHRDINPGDRMSPCKGKMHPVAIWIKDDGEWALLHRCMACGVIKANRVAGDDDEGVLMELLGREKGSS